MLTEEALKDPKIKRSLETLEKMAPFSDPFNNLKEALKYYMMGEEEVDAGVWKNDWKLEVAIMTYLFGEGYA
jgi:hypothetical protein